LTDFPLAVGDGVKGDQSIFFAASRMKQIRAVL
jgi:hypothetical protein